MRSDRPQTIYWLGSHKTGTTFLQQTLEDSLEHLAKSGIHYEPQGAFREAYTRPLLYDHSLAAAAPFAYAGDTEKILIFDENIIGLSGGAAKAEGTLGPRMYPRAVPGLRKVARHLGLQPDAIVLGVRSTATFLASSYMESLRRGRFSTFDAFLQLQELDRDQPLLARMAGLGRISRMKRLRWTELVQRLSRSFKPRQIFVYRYEQLRGHEGELLRQLLDIDPSKLSFPTGPLRPSIFSQKAVDEFAALAAGRSLTREEAFALSERFPIGPEWAPFQPWGRAESLALELVYRWDLRRIAAMQNVTVMDL